jgi:hypothetical protein
MGGLLTVIPIITHTYAQRCVESICHRSSALGVPLDDILVVDNTRDGSADRYGIRTHRDPDGHNLGVARAWNVGAREVLEQGLDYLLLMSSVMVFGPVLHTTWLEQMQRFWGENVIECDGHSWHLIAFHRRVFERVGLFDENYYPAYIEGLDLSYRMRQVGWEGGWRRCWVNALSQGHALHNEVVSCPADPLLSYYAAKWGGKKGEETFALPWGDKPLDYFEDVPIPELAERYGLEVWW